MRGWATALSRAFAAGTVMTATVGCPSLSELTSPLADAAPGRDGGGADAPEDAREAGARDAEDASSCTRVSFDAAPQDAACVLSGDAGACDPGPVTTLEPAWVPPQHPASLCTKKQISEAYTKCFGVDQSTADCVAWQSENEGCKDCIYTFSVDKAYGPVVIDVVSELENVNESGCVALLEPCNLACAEAIQATLACEQASCDPRCPLPTTQASFDALAACETRARTCPCLDHSARASDCEAVFIGRGSPAAICVAAASNVSGEAFRDVLDLFCGP